MVPTHFKHYVLALSHRHGSLVILQTLVAFANTLANAFALIYLIRQGHDYLDCSIFILMSAAVPTMIMAFASRPILKNFPASITTSLICLALYYVALMFLQGWQLVLIPPLLFGTYIATFWIPYFALVMHITSRKKRGAAVGAYFLIFPALTTVAPLLGGFIITYLSYDALFAIGAAVAVVDLFYVSGFRVLRRIRRRIIIPELLQSLRVNLVGRFNVDLDRKGVDWRITSALFAEGIQDGIFWVAIPIITFEFADDEATLSGYLSLFAFWGAVATVALGYLSDRLKDRASIVRIGATFGGVSLLFAAFSGTPEEYLMAISIAYFWIALVPSFLFTMLVDKLERYKKKGVLLREFFLSGGRVGGALCVTVALLLDLEIIGTLAIAGLALAYVIVVR
ncbi:MAG: MFS transporter [Methanobacteriota archaeon]|nr:MAG: MFS transporter [Euryarchaeota archaeon]